MTLAGDAPVGGGAPFTVDRASTSEWIQVVAVLVVFLAVFLWKPISTRDGYYAPLDVSQSQPILRTTSADRQVSNSALGDVGSDIVPWQMYDAAQVRNGELPLWNPYDESGAPHLANARSAALSPFTAPFYVFSLREALVVSAAMVLLASGLFTYGLARHVGSGHLGGVVAALGYMFAGVTVVWLRWPVAAVASLLPAMAWAGLAVVDATTGHRRLLAAGCLAAAVGISLLAGHPQTTCFSIAAVVLIVVGRLVLVRCPLRTAVRRVGLVAAGVAGGVCLGAAQVLPTLEYLANRAPSGQRQAFVDAKLAGLAAFPFFNGSPFGADRSGVLPILLPYVKAVGLYVGAGFLVLAIVGWLALARHRRVLAIVLAVVGGLWLVFVLDAGGLGHQVSKLPGLDLASAVRSIPIWSLGVSLLAGLGTAVVRRSLVDGRAARRRVLIDVAIALGVVVVVGGVLVVQLVGALPHMVSTAGTTASSLRREHLVYVIAWLLVTVVAIVAPVIMLGGRDRRRGMGRALRVGSGVLLLVALFASSGYLWRGWNPTVPRQVVYARSTALDAVQAVVGSDQTLRLDSSAVPPDLNLAYHLRSPEDGDAIGVRDVQALYRRLLHPRVEVVDGEATAVIAGPVSPAGIGNLRMLGIRWVTTGTPYPFADGSLTAPTASGGRGEVAWIVAGRASGPKRVTELVVTSLSADRGTRCTFEVRSSKGRVQFVATPCGSPGVAVALPRPVTVGHGFTVALSVTDARGRPVTIAPGAALTAVDTKVAGLVLAADVEGSRVYRVPGAPAHVFSPASSVADDPGGRVVDDPGAVPARRSFIEDPDGGSSGSRAGTVQVTRDEPGDIRFDVTRATAGWVVVMEADYPGWRATVDGRDATVREANGAFLAVRVPAGTSSVTVRYRPASVQIGVIVSLVSLGLLTAGAVVVTWGSWRRRRGRAGP